MSLGDWLRRRFGDGREFYTYSPHRGWRRHRAGGGTQAVAPPDSPLPPQHPDRPDDVKTWAKNIEQRTGQAPEPPEIVELPPEPA